MKKLITIKLAAEILGVSIETLRNWDLSGKLKAIRGKNKYRLYNISRLEKFASRKKIKRNQDKRANLILED